MPSVLSPVFDIARGAGDYPVIVRSSGCACIFGVIPGAGPAITLKSKNHSLPIWHHLIHVHLKVRNGAGRIGEVNPAVVDKIVGGGVVAEAGSVALTAVIRVRGIELEGVAADRWRTDHCHRTVGGAIGSRIMD